MEIHKCNLCSSAQIRKIEYVDEVFTNSEIFKEISIIHCKECGFGQIDNEIDSNLLTEFYASEYRAPGSKFHYDYRTLHAGEMNYRAYSQIKLAKKYCKKLSRKQKMNFLDLGAGSGSSFAMLDYFYKRNSKFGLEFEKEAIDFVRNSYGVENYLSYKELANANQSFDIILMSHSLEHFQFSQISELLETIREKLGSDGVVCIEVPNCIKEYYDSRSSDAPHTLFFTKESLVKLFKMNNFDILFCESSGNKYMNKEQVKTIGTPKYLWSLLMKVQRYLTWIILDRPRVDTQHADFDYSSGGVNLRLIARAS